MSLKVVTWNVNGLRAALKNTSNDLKGFLNSLEADIVCLQETKATSESGLGHLLSTVVCVFFFTS